MAKDEKAMRTLFNAIAPQYDRVNTVATVGRDRAWRMTLVAHLAKRLPNARARVIDVATGTGEVALALANALPAANVIGCDIAPEMLARAEEKKCAAGVANVSFVVGNALAIPFTDASFSAVSVAFGVRNVPDRTVFLDEAHRILDKGGTLWVLEFFAPRSFFGRVFTSLYVGYVLPLLSFLFRGRGWRDYRYLARSITAFASRDAFIREAEERGFALCDARRLFFGVADVLGFEKRGRKDGSAQERERI